MDNPFLLPVPACKQEKKLSLLSLLSLNLRKQGAQARKKIVPIVSIVFETSASKGRPRRGRTSITAGEESEANVTCGFTAI